MRRTNRALLVVNGIALLLGLAGAVVAIAAVVRGFNPALLLVLAAVVPLVIRSIRDGAFEIRLLRALNRSPR